MRKISFLICTACCLLFNAANKAVAQDGSNVVLTAYVPDQIENFPAEAADLLENKLRQVVTQSGVGANSGASRFIITANVNVIGKDILPGPPPQHVYNLDVTLYIGDGIVGKKFASKTISVKGVGTSETKAYIDGFKKINANNAELKAFVAEGKNRVVEYYNSNCNVIIKEAQVMASQNDYEGAIFQLSSVPSAATGCYNQSSSLLASMYKKYMDRQCKVRLAEARNQWNASLNSEGAAYAAEVLSTIDPNAACYKEAVALSQEIGKRVKEVDKREWDFKMKQFDADVAVSKAMAQAYRSIAEAYIKNQPKAVSYNVNGWW